MKTFAALACAALLAACSSTPAPQPAAQTAGAKPAAPAAEAPKETVTGSRLAKQSSDRHVRKIDNATWKEDASQIRSLGNTAGIGAN